MKIEGLSGLTTVLRKLARDCERMNRTVQVGFTQNYAIYVHEDLSANHPVGQAKFLEEPSRSMGPELSRIIRTIFKETGSMEDALMTAGLRLQREAQLRTPVDTSALKASAYTAMERDAPQAAAEAFASSEAIRVSSKGAKP